MLGRLDVQQNEFVGLLVIEHTDGVHRITDVARLVELDGLVQTALGEQ
jgi:hypothetical protein